MVNCWRRFECCLCCDCCSRLSLWFSRGGCERSVNGIPPLFFFFSSNLPQGSMTGFRSRLHMDESSFMRITPGFIHCMNLCIVLLLQFLH
ncbi:hypothetical protein ACN38_g4588 [Penicillium nordicum]|uniref:Uncharacterized protein n=1 Tax=Penicillium nordicum TaxID=229535 RepID=A0A0M9WGY7_9EURO|nr:hypothetical protein ACN38_g4588 [Penicillium nordicum]